jgi:uncharacterized SAM-binding protein YcdF (DUF218 family)
VSRRRRLLAAVAVTLLLVPAIVHLWAAHGDVPRDPGIVVVLGGGAGERTQHALAFRPAESTLVLSAGAVDEAAALGLDCGAPRVECWSPGPRDTRGEVLAARELVRERGGPVVLVTSDYHVRRVRLLADRCAADAELTATAPPAPGFGPRRISETAQEIAAVGAILLGLGGC